MGNKRGRGRVTGVWEKDNHFFRDSVCRFE